MFQKILLLFFLLIGIFQVDGYFTDECKTTTPITTEGIHDFFYFSSPAFPKTLSNLTYSYPCGINLAAADAGNRIWLAMLNGKVNQIILTDNGVKQTISQELYLKICHKRTFLGSSIDFEIRENASLQTWTAFQAVALVYDPKLNLSCPFTTQIFDFSTNPQLIIPIASEFVANTTFVFKACNWSFKLSYGQQLKVLIKKLNLSPDFILTLNADGNVKKVFNSTVNYFSEVHYFDGTNFNLTFTDQWSNSSASNFFILISVVTKTNTYTLEGCKTPVVNGTFTTFSNIDYLGGYKPNQKCTDTITIPQKSEATLYIEENHTEMFADLLTITDKNSHTYGLQLFYYTSALFYYTLTKDADQAIMNFKSDGNVQEAGYKVVMKTYECKCPDNNFVIPCDGQKQMLSLADNAVYCDNMKCNYTILPNPSCPNAYFYIQVYPMLRSIDNLLFKDNGMILQNITSSSHQQPAIYYSSKAKLTFEFSSGITNISVSQDSKQWFVAATNTSVPNFKKFNLNDSSPNNVVWLDTMKKNDAITVCSDDKNLEIFVTQSAFNSLTNYVLYDGNDLYSSIGSLDSETLTSPSKTYPRRMTSSSGCLTVYKAYESSANVETTLLFRKAKTNTNSCSQQNTVFQPSIYGDNFTVTSTKSGLCEMIILLGSTDEIPKIWLTINERTPNSIYSFTDLAINKKLFDMDSSSQNQNLGIYTTALSITVPPSSVLSLTAANSYSQFIKVQSLPQKGIMTSPRYSNAILSNTLLYVFQQDVTGDITANFVVKYLTGSPTVNLQIDNSRIPLSSNSNATVTGKNFMLYYSSFDFVNDSFLIEYTLQKAEVKTSGSAKNGFGAVLLVTLVMLFALI